MPGGQGITCLNYHLHGLAWIVKVALTTHYNLLVAIHVHSTELDIYYLNDSWNIDLLSYHMVIGAKAEGWLG